MGKLKNHADKIVVSSPKATDVIITQRYVCQIHAHRHINVRALENGYLEEISVKEGQAVKKGDSMFKILPTLYPTKLDAETAEAKPSPGDGCAVQLAGQAKLDAETAKATLAKANLAKTELNLNNVTAPFDGIVDRLHEQLGSLVKEGDILTTLSDNSVMWVYFNVPEKKYLEYMAARKQDQEDPKVELVLANSKNSRIPARSVRSRPYSTTRPGTSPSARISQTRTACCVTVRPAPS